MHRRPLILAPRYDVHAAAVAWGLAQVGISALWSKSASIADEAIGNLSFFTDGATKMSTRDLLSLRDVSAIWYRRARMPSQFPGARPCDTNFLREEWALFQRNFYALAEKDVFWVNAPAAARAAENKLMQLNAAIQCGLQVPPTLVSNDPEEVIQFRRRHERVIHKTFDVHTWIDEASGTGGSAHASLVPPGLELDDRSVRLCPGIYQRYVEKAADIRVTVIGNRYFASKISVRSGGAFVDWRSHLHGEGFLAEPCEISEAVWSKLQSLMAALGIVFGCVDLAVDIAGEVHFLEVNQGGQFLFVEALVSSHPLLQAMCAMLASGRADYALAASSPISYAAYLRSDAHEAWSEELNRQPPSAQEAGTSLTREQAA